MPEIEITVNLDDYSLEVEGHGFHGNNCIKTIDDFQKLVGAQTVSQKEKPELQRRQSTTRVSR